MLTGPVKFSLLLEIQIDSPTPALERQAFLDCVEQAVLADELGYDTVWAVEHHGLLEYSHCSAPEVLLGAFSQVSARSPAWVCGGAHPADPPGACRHAHAASVQPSDSGG